MNARRIRVNFVRMDMVIKVRAPLLNGETDGSGFLRRALPEYLPAGGIKSNITLLPAGIVVNSETSGSKEQPMRSDAAAIPLLK
jgi:hypothetical protein